MSQADGIAIIGIGCRFPGGASTPAGYWDILKSGTDGTSEVPEERWSLRRFYDADPAVPGKIYVRRGGYLDESIREFDAGFFGISPRDAAPMDPQQRLLLEVTWEAFEDAGVLPAELGGSRTGVYMGGFTLDNKIHLLSYLNREAISAHTAISATLVMLSNRIAYAFDLRGPAMTVDTACSSSMVAIHLACQALRDGDCDLALAGGVNLMFRPAYSVAMCKGGFLSPDGRCRAFDARADGYARGEGAGVLVLKGLDDALRAGDDIRAVIAATGVNQDGRTDGITLPNQQAQEELIHDVLQRSGIEASSVQYVEAHGTGTRAGDTAEAKALHNSFAKGRGAGAPLLFGSAKSNIGHLEAAAGVAGVIKVALSLEKRQIPPSIHFESPPENLDLAAMGLEVPTRLRDWPASSGCATAAVNSFGYGGTNAHALMTEPPPRERLAAPRVDRPRIIPLSARSDVSLTRSLHRLHRFMMVHSDLGLADVGYTLARRRTHHQQHRAALIASSDQQLRVRLKEFFETSALSEDAGFITPTAPHRSPRVAFVYTGMGPQSFGMGAELLEQDPVVRAAFDRCETIWQRLAGWSLLDLFGNGSGEPMREPKYAQPANFVLQVMLTELARAYGLRPDGVTGHSTGEIAAAWAAEALTLEDALFVTWQRSRLQQEQLGSGRMLAVGLSAKEVVPFLSASEGRVEVAAINGPSSVTFTGDEADLEELSSRFESSGLFSRMLKVDVAYHSRFMDVIEPAIRSTLADLYPGRAKVPLYSTVTGDRLTELERGATHWWKNIRQPVLFAGALESMLQDGYSIFVEVGPHPVLASGIRECTRRTRKRSDCFALLRRGAPEVESVACSVGRLFAAGVDLDWPSVYPAGNQVPLPAYPWDREDLWVESEASRGDRLGAFEHPFLSARASEAERSWEGDLSLSFHPYLRDHRIQGEPVFPGAGFVELAIAAVRGRVGSIGIADIRFRNSLAVLDTPVLRLHLESGNGGGFRIYSRARQPDARWTLNVTGRLLAESAPPRDGFVDLASVQARCTDVLDVSDFYESAARKGLEYGPAFQCITAGGCAARESWTHLELPVSCRESVEEFFAHPVLLDGALQSALALQLQRQPDGLGLPLPVGIAEFRFHRKAGIEVYCRCVFRSESADGIRVDLVVFDPDGAVVLEVLGVETKMVREAADVRGRDVLFTNAWVEQRARSRDVVAVSNYLVFGDRQGVSDRMLEDATQHRVKLKVVHAAQRFALAGDEEFDVVRGNRADVDRVLQAMDAASLDGVVYLWALDAPGDPNEAPPSVGTGFADVIDLMNLVKGLNAVGRPDVPITVVTVGCRNAESVESAPSQHALIGAVRALLVEEPSLKIRLLDLNSTLPFTAARDVLCELRSHYLDPEVAYEASTRYVGRIVPFRGQRRGRRASSSPDTRYALKTLEQAADRKRGYVERRRCSPNRLEVEVAVAQYGFDDADDAAVRASAGGAPILRLQCWGRVVAVGEAVDSVHVDDRVFVIPRQPTIASHVMVEQSSVVRVPPGFPADQCAAFADWLWARRILFGIGRLCEGMTVLLHTASSSLGLAMVGLADRAGARVIATSDTEDKRSRLRSMGVELVADSSSLGFRDDVLRWTDGRGVDLVVSNLAGDLRATTMELVTGGGDFIDVTRGARSREEVVPLSCLRSGVCFRRVELGEALGGPSSLGTELEEVGRLLSEDWNRAFPSRTVPASAVEEAFEALSGEGVTGKLVVDVATAMVTLERRARVPAARPDATYLVTGGFGGVGLSMLTWLADQGARNIVVLSRSGPSTPNALETVSALEARGCRVISTCVDIADSAGLSDALGNTLRELPPPRGLVHCAGVLRDQDFESMDAASVTAVMGPKALGCLNLHRILSSYELDFFVCYSSIAGTLGNAGQFNYAAANGFLHGLVSHRRRLGLAGTCLALGPVAGTGMATRDAGVAERLRGAGLAFMPVEQVLDLMHEAITQGWVSFDAVAIDWNVWHQRASRSMRRRLAEIVSEEAGLDSTETLRSELEQLAPTERRVAMFQIVTDIVARVLRISPSRIDALANLKDLGIDSLMATELHAAIVQRTGVRLRSLYLTRGPSLEDMADAITTALLTGWDATAMDSPREQSSTVSTGGGT